MRYPQGQQRARERHLAVLLDICPHGGKHLRTSSVRTFWRPVCRQLGLEVPAGAAVGRDPKPPREVGGLPARLRAP
eukprot:7156662-Lingulodinium_polyedra.AAC.1